MPGPRKRPLQWPPKKEDLETLYLAEKLSAAKIAAVYGLSYRNAKVGESTILYQLKRNGIPRRDPAELARKVTVATEDEWIRRYQAGESLKTIAGETVDAVTVWNHLKARGVALRDKVEAQICAVVKYEKKPFQGDDVEKAYLMGLRFGDLDAVKHGRAVRVRVSTTHPAMANLFESVFSPCGFVHRYPREAEFTGYEWSLECDLDASFAFLLAKPSVDEVAGLPRRRFFAFLAGFHDAEGSIVFHRKKKWGAFEISMSNMDEPLLNVIRGRLAEFGYVSVVRSLKQKHDRGVKNGQDHIWRLEIFRGDDVRRMLVELRVRHPEKKAKAEIALLLPARATSTIVHAVHRKWEALLAQIETQRIGFILKAKAATLSRAAPRPEELESCLFSANKPRTS